MILGTALVCTNISYLHTYIRALERFLIAFLNPNCVHNQLNMDTTRTHLKCTYIHTIGFLNDRIELHLRFRSFVRECLTLHGSTTYIHNTTRMYVRYAAAWKLLRNLS